jgi:CheY-like chemotaxis protein
LTRQLLAFSRKQILTPKVLDLNALVTQTAGMLRRVIGADLELCLTLEPRLGKIKADPGQVEQILLNLAVNARDAMPHGGTLTIATSNSDTVSPGARSPECPAGPYVMLRMTDTGCGMDEQVKAHLFEPFFTTKEVGKGTGLGLATIYGIVKQSGGHIEVVSEVGRGTTFRIFLPRIEASTERREPESAPPRPRPGRETVLVVEDEAVVRELTRTILKRQGYTVLEAYDGAEALRVDEQYAGRIDLLVTDVMMPRMNGRQLAEQLLLRRPDVQVLYVSGHTEDTLVQQGVLKASATFLQKPFTSTVLVRTVREVLDRQTVEL